MNKSKKAVAIVVAALCMGLMITGCGKQEGSLQESASQMSSEPESSHKSIQEELAEQYGVSTQAIQNIYDACAAVGMVTENMEFTTTETLENGNKSFTIIYEENEFKAYLYPDETVCEVDSGNNEIVFYQDGTVWEQVEDRIVTIAQKRDFDGAKPGSSKRILVLSRDSCIFIRPTRLDYYNQWNLLSGNWPCEL